MTEPKAGDNAHLKERPTDQKILSGARSVARHDRRFSCRLRNEETIPRAEKSRALPEQMRVCVLASNNGSLRCTSLIIFYFFLEQISRQQGKITSNGMSKETSYIKKRCAELPGARGTNELNKEAAIVIISTCCC